ncbi:MAG: hypothetical protein INQ03_01805 [Candidatus Heimdallarchaeota archaeon]|nr:hypothetical protein [Candidatus Heimdallarchaeota archaeon]
MKAKFILMLTTLLMGSLFVFNTNSVTAVGSLSSEIEAGDTYWFNVDSFPTFAEFLDLTGANDELAYSNVSISTTGGFVGSDLYVKVLSTQTENFAYYDGAVEKNDSIPTVDINVGMITGEAMTQTITNTTSNEVLLTNTIPAGIGLPVPFIFGTSSYFNVSYIPDTLLPVPFALNDDYATHSAIFAQLDLMLPSASDYISTVSDTTKFEVEADITLDVNASVAIYGKISWNKADGVVDSLYVELYNSSTDVELFTPIQISQSKVENIPVLVEVGDKYELTIDSATFDFTTSGFEDVGMPEMDDVLGDIKSNFTQFEGSLLLELEVKEVHGMYYRVEGSVFNGTDNPRIAVPDAGNEAWMVGFGRMGPGMPLPIGSWNEDETVHDMIRGNAVPGFVTSKDFTIYAAWDKTLQFASTNVISNVMANLEYLPEFGTPGAEFLDIKSSLTANPIITAGYTYGETSVGGYEIGVITAWDVIVDTNQTTYDSIYAENGTWLYDYEGWAHVKAETKGGLEFASTYDEHGDYEGVSFTGDIWGKVDITVKDINGTHSATLEASISNIDFTILGVVTRVNPITTPVDTTDDTTDDTSNTTDDTSDTTDDTTDDATLDGPLGDLPGFEFILTLMSFSAVVFVVNKKRR